MKKYVYMFTEGNKDMRNILGGKGANLAEMTNIGLPVPRGFTISTSACINYYENNKTINPFIKKQIEQYITKLEKITNKEFGSIKNPLLVSIRSGARASMPGMMDTILNLGLNDDVVKTLANKSNNERWAYDCYRRFIQMYSDVVMGIDKNIFERIIDKYKDKKNVKQDIELDENDLKNLVIEFKKEYKKRIKKEFPNNPKIQLLNAIKAVFDSWDNPRANVYRRDNDIPYSWGTAVNVQEMVYGNMGSDCGTGVAFTRDPSTGKKGLFGEFLTNAQGEDVVAGVRTPIKISEMSKKFPQAYKEFKKVCDILEKHYKDMQDMEFTIEHGKLFMLQTRNGKRTAEAALKIACDLVDEKKKTPKEALLMIDPRNLDALLHQQFDSKALKKIKPIGKGLGASPGAACGKIVFTASEAEKLAKKGEKVILVRLETSPEDITGMKVSEGILTVRGGMTSHAAVVARGMGECCVSGCGDINIDEINKKFILNNKIYKEGDYISLDGGTGNIYEGKIPTIEAVVKGDFKRVMNWADKYRKLEIRTNADTPKDTKKAIELGAQGIGLCRTEHMFFDKKRIFNMRKMILSNTTEEREKALKELIKYQKKDFKEMYIELKGRPMTVRYLDPPLHEFLPKTKDEIIELAKSMNITVKAVKEKCESLKEFNPMMGHRGCRLDITYPEIAKMQTKALLEAAIEVNKEKKYKTNPEIMIPLVNDKKELDFIKNIIIQTAEQVKKEKKSKIKYSIGTMIETPRAALLADEIAKSAEFFSFGTNDLTQLTYGFSRDDAGKFLGSYFENKIFEQDPFEKLDQTGVGILIKNAISISKKTNKKLHYGICGEHAGDPSSIEFCHNNNFNYVSCSPYRIPIARLAAAQAAIKSHQK